MFNNIIKIVHRNSGHSGVSLNNTHEKEDFVNKQVTYFHS